MSKDLPYFKFVPTEYLLGTIGFLSDETQGVFTKTISHYWQRECDVTMNLLNQLLGNREAIVKQLIDANIIKWDKDSDKINIDFLDEQFEELTGLSKKRSKAGKTGGEARAKQWLSKREANATEGVGIKKRKEKKRKEIKVVSVFEEFRLLYPGTKRGYETEYKNFMHHPDWQTEIDKLLPALQSQITKRAELSEQQKNNSRIFIPSWKNLSTWISKRCWEEESKNGVDEIKKEPYKFIPGEKDAMFTMTNDEFKIWKQQELQKMKKSS